MSPQPNVRVTIQLGYFPSDDDRTYVIPIDEYILHKASQVMDFPPANGDVFARMLSTPKAFAEETKYNREALIEGVADQIAHALSEERAKNDIERGYPRR